MEIKEKSCARVFVSQGRGDYNDRAAVHALVFQALDGLRLPPRYIRPGDRVVLKPNWVKEHDERTPGPNNWEHVVTHPYVIEAVSLWAAARLGDSGSVVACDGPQTDSSFETIRRYCELDAMLDRCRKQYPKIEFEVLDLRPEEWHTIDGVKVSGRKLGGDPKGGTLVALDDASEFVGFPGLGRLFGASYDLAETNERHQGLRHEYMLCGTPMSADVLINLPKLKTHKKVGITCSLKNLVGINANKNWLPHHTEGTVKQGGDQFPDSTAKSRLEHRLMGAAKRFLNGRQVLSRLFVPVKKLGRVFFGDTDKIVRSGNWHGNDTCWRMVLDLNKCLFYFDETGARRKRELHYITVVDGIIGGEGNGPMAPDPKNCGVVIAGRNPLATDCVAAKLMGFDWKKLKMLRRAFDVEKLPLSSFAPHDIIVRSNDAKWNKRMIEFSFADSFKYNAHFGWKGAIELEPNEASEAARRED